MPECSETRFAFQPLGSRAVIARFNGGDITSDGGARLRPANRDASADALEEIERIVKHIRTQWPTVRMTLRADAGFCREPLMAWSEAHDIAYVFGRAKNVRLLADSAGRSASTCSTGTALYGQSVSADGTMERG
jgi:hypothetical protein